MPILIHTIVIVILVLSTPFTATATDHTFNITSAKTAFIDEGILYVSAGYPLNHENFQTKLKSLWENAGHNIRIDSYRQPWREAPLAQLERVFGSIDKNYLAIFDGEVHVHEAKKAFLWRWGCDEISLIPVLELGPLKFSKKPWEWGVDAFGVTSLPAKLEIHPLDKKLIPKEFYQPLSAPDGWELWVNGTKRFTYIDRNQEHDVAPKNQLLDHKSGTLRIIIERSPMDVRC